MRQIRVNVTLNSLLFAYESGDFPLSFLAKHQVPLAKNNVKQYGGHLGCSLVNIKVDHLVEHSGQICTLKLETLSMEEEKINIA